LRHSFRLEAEAIAIEQAVQQVLAAGYRTRDLAASGEVALSTSEMGSRVVETIAATLKTTRTQASRSA
jgi:3-isopropylmalate dehydrogenase